jgi:hypothetical protein
VEEVVVVMRRRRRGRRMRMVVVLLLLLLLLMMMMMMMLMRSCVMGAGGVLVLGGLGAGAEPEVGGSHAPLCRQPLHPLHLRGRRLLVNIFLYECCDLHHTTTVSVWCFISSTFEVGVCR